jgi:hypothetical protein
VKGLFSRILTLTVILLWGSGFGQYAHERVEHGNEAAWFKAAQAAAGHRKLPLPPHHSEDDCATCQMLATMAAHHTPPPPLPSLVQNLIEAPIVEHVAPMVADVCSYAPIRGPPATGSSHIVVL